MSPEPGVGSLIQTLHMISRVLDTLGVQYCVCGSVAGSYHGVPRTTMDADVVAALSENQVLELRSLLGDDYYLDVAGACEAIQRRGSFNVIRMDTLDKVDVFIPGPDAWSLGQLSRCVRGTLDPLSPGVETPIASAEDVILHKLSWYRMGGSVSDRQWRDVMGVIKVQAQRLDLEYMRRWAGSQGLTELLCRALDESGISSAAP